MKKTRIISLTTLILSLTLSFNPIKIDRVNASTTYEINSFNELPEDWNLSNQSDVNYSSNYINENELVLSHTKETNPGPSLYYGSLYSIANNLTFEDFTFEITFKMINAISNTRWFGILYHANTSANNTIGYLMNYRYNGSSSASCVNSSRSFADENSTSASPLSDNKYHNVKIVMCNNVASHYVDGALIKSWDVNIKNAHLGVDNYLNSGKFGLIVNQSTVQIKNIKISNEAEEGLKINSTIVDTYEPEYDAINLPTVISKDCSLDKIEEISNSNTRPSNIILNMNDEGKIYDKNGNVSTFKEVYKKIENKIIPIIRIESDNSTSYLNNFLTNQVSILDIGVISSNPYLIKKVKQTHKSIRGIIEFDEINDLKNIVATSNINYGLIVTIPSSLATNENVFYLQARFKTVWIDVVEENNFSIYNSINTGAYGLIVNDYNNVYNLYKNYDENTLIRSQFNSAHRGLPEKYNENSLSGVTAAIENGATHIEIDAYLTTDNEIVIMHDADISTSTNGTGNVESYSLEELRQYKLDLFEPYEDIPTLDDIIDVMKGKNAVLILEIKSSKTALIDCLKSKLDEYDFYGQIVSISFNKDILAKIKSTIPELPTAYLGTASIDNFASTLELMGQYNTTIDTNFINSSKEFNTKYLKDRGIIGWFWTFDGMAQIEILARQYGYIGITSDIADRYKDQILRVKGIETTLANEQVLHIDDELDLEAIHYDETTHIVQGNVFAIKEHESYYNVICSYRKISTNQGSQDKVYYTDAFKVMKALQTSDVDTTNEPPLGNNYESIAFVVIGIIGLIGLLMITYIMIKKSHKNKIKKG